MTWLLTFLLACAPTSTDASKAAGDAPPEAPESEPVEPGGDRAREGGGGVAPGTELYRTHSADGRVEAWVVRVADGTELWLSSGSDPWRHATAGAPDRIALSDDGAHVAWVASLDSLPSVHVSATEPGAEALPLTNVGLAAARSGPPDHFVPPPVREGSLRFDGPWLRWEGPDGPQRVRWQPHDRTGRR